MADLVLEQTPPSARALEIQDLFRRAGQPGFNDVYERAYRLREPAGMRSWLGMEKGQAVLHISVTPERFSDGQATLTGGFLGDLMADASYRQFWHPLKLVRRMVADVRRDGLADFLVTSFVPAAEGVFKAAGFKPFALMQRGVMPLVWPYPVARRLLRRLSALPLVAIPFADPRTEQLVAAAPPGSTFRPAPTLTHYRSRLPRVEYPSGTWLVAGTLEAPQAMALVSETSPHELVIADVLWADGVRVPALLSGVARWAARAGHRRLYLTTFPESELAQAARRTGFLPRPDASTFMILPIGDPGAIPAPDRWTLTPFALTGW